MICGNSLNGEAGATGKIIDLCLVKSSTIFFYPVHFKYYRPSALAGHAKTRDDLGVIMCFGVLPIDNGVKEKGASS
jgi:hypothetical protein